MEQQKTNLHKDIVWSNIVAVKLYADIISNLLSPSALGANDVDRLTSWGTGLVDTVIDSATLLLGFLRFLGTASTAVSYPKLRIPNVSA